MPGVSADQSQQPTALCPRSSGSRSRMEKTAGGHRRRRECSEPHRRHRRGLRRRSSNSRVS